MIYGSALMGTVLNVDVDPWVMGAGIGYRCNQKNILYLNGKNNNIGSSHHVG
jgi:hypothetical protein